MLVLSVDVLLWGVAIVFALIYVLSFRWAQGLFAKRNSHQVAPARAVGRRGHRGFGEEPAWVRSVQSAIVAFGVTGISMSGVGIVGLSVYALLGG